MLDVAHSHPKINVTGIDMSRTMIEYARAQAWSQGLNNATFKIMDALKPLEFASASFDLVNARFLQGFTPAAVWPKLIQEFVRITRPGGIIRITESEDHGVTNSPGFQRLSGIAMQALKNARYSFSPDGRSTGLIPVIGRFLRDAGCQDVHLSAYVIDCSAGTEAHGVYNQNFMVAYKLAQPFFLKWGGVTQEEVDQIYQQMLDEMGSSDFCGVWMYVTTWAHTPRI